MLAVALNDGVSDGQRWSEGGSEIPAQHERDGDALEEPVGNATTAALFAADGEMPSMGDEDVIERFARNAKDGRRSRRSELHVASA